MKLYFGPNVQKNKFGAVKDPKPSIMFITHSSLLLLKALSFSLHSDRDKRERERENLIAEDKETQSD